MLFIGNNWVRKDDFSRPSDTNNQSDKLLKEKALVYEFAKWLSEQNFTNPDISIHDWVERFFNGKET